ncbi:MAG: Penicillinase repressor [Candidatus Marinimicrobia bacterium]|nr:Penicillinase repressor [Candidatus Neomarinimicrobiota bacterium]
MASPDKQLTDLEWEVMNHIWELGDKISVREMIDAYYPDGAKAYTTIQTVMNTLVDKGFLTKEKIGLVNFYTPTRKREQVIHKEMHYFINKVFRGSMPQFVKYFIGEESLSEQEITELKEVIREKEDTLKGENHG